MDMASSNIGRIADVCSGAARRASHRDVASTRWRQPEGGIPRVYLKRFGWPIQGPWRYP